MPEYDYDSQHGAFVKHCIKCSTTYVGHVNQQEAEKVLSKFFAQDQATKDGFYARCRECVSKAQRASRDGRLCNPEELLKLQEGKCGVCEKSISFERGPGGKVLSYVDHNHKTNQVRGILCPRCNSLLAIVENTEWRNKAIQYLKRYGCE